MISVRIETGKVGLVYRGDSYRRVLAPGKHWIWPVESVVLFDTTVPFVPATDSRILLQDGKLAAMLHVIDVRDHEIVMRFDDGNLKSVLTTGRYMYWRGLVDYTFLPIDLRKHDIVEAVTMNDLTRKELVPYVRMYAVEAYEKGVLWVDGKFSAVLNPGVYAYWKNATVLSVVKAEQRQQQIEISGQEILTKDKAMLRLNVNVLYRMVDIVKAVVDNKDYEKQFYLLVQMALREVVGTLTLDELLDRKDAIATHVLEATRVKAAELGLEVRSCGVRDVILPGEMKDIMNQVLVAQKKAEANMIMRREETASTRSLLNTARLMEDNAMLFKLKEMEYVEKIAEKINSISVSSGGQIVDQLKDIFGTRK